jgi:hypothetical protein
MFPGSNPGVATIKQMTINFRKLHVWYRWRRRQKTIKRLAREIEARIAEKAQIEQRIYKSAVQDILVTNARAPGGAIIIDKARQNIERWASISAAEPRTKRDLVEDCEWWEIDITNAYNNTRRIPIEEVKKFFKDIDI